MSVVQFRPKAPSAVVAQLVERHLAKVEVASPSLVYRSIFYLVPSPSGKAKVCKTFIPGPNPGGTSMEGPVALRRVFLFLCKQRKINRQMNRHCTDYSELGALLKLDRAEVIIFIAAAAIAICCEDKFMLN